MRIVVDNSSYDLLNFGDEAMLRVGLARVQQLWPNARLDVFTYAPERLMKVCPGVRPFIPDGRMLWLQDRNIVGAAHKLFPKSAEPWLVEFESTLRTQFPTWSRNLVEKRFQKRQVDPSSMRAFLDLISRADLLLLTGGGYLTDAFADLANRVLETTRLANRLGVPIAMMGQGLGPMKTPILRKKLRESMSGVVTLGMREKRTGKALLEAIGARTDRVVTTGDDAIELAYSDKLIDRPIGAGLGINLRISGYSSLDQTTIDAVRAVAAKYHARGTQLVPVPISRFPNERDCDSIRKILCGINDHCNGGADVDSVEEVVQQVARCRVVLTGAYHAAVFALSQGIPAVCVRKSGYYADKFLGLADLFGAGCYVIAADDADFGSRLMQAVEQAWQSADATRAGLLKAAKWQLEASRQAYHDLHERAPRPPQRAAG